LSKKYINVSTGIVKSTSWQYLGIFTNEWHRMDVIDIGLDVSLFKKVRRPLNASKAEKPIHNTGYQAAVWKELKRRQGGPLPLKQDWIYVTKARLNAALKAAQHCR
jgi:hypothetical protein